MEPNYQKHLCQQCEQRGITLSETQLKRLLQYLELLLHWRAHLMRLAAPLLRPGGILLVRKPLQTPELQEVIPLLAAATWGEVQTLPILPATPSPWCLLAIPRLV